MKPGVLPAQAATQPPEEALGYYTESAAEHLRSIKFGWLWTATHKACPWRSSWWSKQQDQSRLGLFSQSLLELSEVAEFFFGSIVYSNWKWKPKGLKTYGEIFRAVQVEDCEKRVLKVPVGVTEKELVIHSSWMVFFPVRSRGFLTNARKLPEEETPLLLLQMLPRAKKCSNCTEAVAEEGERTDRL